MHVVYVVVHWLHLVAAISAVGGALILRMVVHPAAMKLGEAERATFQAALLPKLSKFVRHSVVTLFVTGFVNLVRQIQTRPDFHGVYGGVFMLKFLLAMGVFFIAIGLVVPGDAFAKIQANRPKWMLINVLLGFAVVFLSAWLRMMPVVPKGPADPSAVVEEATGGLESPALRRLIEEEEAAAPAAPAGEEAPAAP